MISYPEGYYDECRTSKKTMSLPWGQKSHIDEAEIQADPTVPEPDPEATRIFVGRNTRSADGISVKLLYIKLKGEDTHAHICSSRKRLCRLSCSTIDEVNLEA